MRWPSPSPERPRLRLEAVAAALRRRAGAGAGPCDLILRDFFLSCQKETPQTPKRKPLLCLSMRKICPLVRVVTDFQVVIPASDSLAQRRPRLASLTLAPLTGENLQGSAASVSEAVHGRPSCAWMQRSAPHQRMTSVSEARSASASLSQPGRFSLGRHSRFFGQDQRNGVALAPLAGGLPQRGAQRSCIQAQLGPPPLAAASASLPQPGHRTRTRRTLGCWESWPVISPLTFSERSIIV